MLRIRRKGQLFYRLIVKPSECQLVAGTGAHLTPVIRYLRNLWP